MSGVHPTLYARTLAALEVSPCDACRFAERCAGERLACAAFAMFLRGVEPHRWKAAPRAPTSARYLALFGEPPRKATPRSPRWEDPCP